MQGIEPAVQDFYLNNVTCYFPFSFWCIIAFRVNCSKILCWLRKNSSTWGHLYFLQGWTPYQFIFYSATFQNNSNKKKNQSVHISIEAQSNLPQVCPVYIKGLNSDISLHCISLPSTYFPNISFWETEVCQMSCTSNAETVIFIKPMNSRMYRYMIMMRSEYVCSSCFSCTICNVHVYARSNLSCVVRSEIVCSQQYNKVNIVLNQEQGKDRWVQVHVCHS
jgi:hypothetical protein